VPHISVAVTTIRPKLGIIDYKDHRKISVADLPGLIEGAHVNIGMGHKFLKHVERTKLLLFIVDIQGFQLSSKYKRRSCLETVVLLNKEIELYKPDLLKMPTMLIINKMDTDNADDMLKEIKPMLQNLSEYVATCPKEMQPNQVVHFKDIVSTSLIMKNDLEIEMIKEKIRDILDKYEEQQHATIHGASLDFELMEKIRRQNKQQASIVV
jgi:serine/threonine-protein kinase OSR1/STK39